MLSNTTRMFVLEFLFRHKTSLEILSILQGYKIRKSLSCRLRLPKRTHLNSAPKIFRFVSFFSKNGLRNQLKITNLIQFRFEQLH